MDDSPSYTADYSTSYDNYTLDTTPTQTQDQPSEQGTSTEYVHTDVDRTYYPSDSTTQDAYQQGANDGPFPGRNRPTAPPYGMPPGMYPHDDMSVQQPIMMPQPYPPHHPYPPCPPYPSYPSSPPCPPYPSYPSSPPYPPGPPYNGQYIPDSNQVQPEPTVHYIDGQPEPVMLQSEQPAPPQNSTCAIIMSCFAFWFCGIFFGLFAFILAMVGRGASNERKRRNCTNASYALSIIGVITGIIIIGVFGTTWTDCNPTCSYDSYYEDGCWHCCDYKSCSSGSYRDSRNCLQCCESTGWCNYGSYNDTRGCKKCCFYSIMCPSYNQGYRADNNQCC